MKAVMEVPSTERTSHTLTHTVCVIKTNETKLCIDLNKKLTNVFMCFSSAIMEDESIWMNSLSPLAVGRQPHIQFIDVWYDSLDKHLLVVSLTIWTWNTQ